MKKKTANLVAFINALHKHITEDRQFRKDTKKKSEAAIQAEIRPLIISYLKKHFAAEGYKDSDARANKAFYWEAQEGKFGRQRTPTFGARNYPDFIITEPYLIAIEYKQSANGSTVKQGIGQSLMHTMSGDFDYVYYLFHDESKDKRIRKSHKYQTEQRVIERICKDFNVFIRFV